MVGAGVHTTQTVGLALATDLAPVEAHPKIVGLMYVMLLLGMLVSALVFGHLLADFTPGKLVQVIQGSAVVTMALNLFSLWKQEPRDRTLAASIAPIPTFRESWDSMTEGGRATRRLLAIGLGTLGFSMQDVLLEPYGGQVLGLTVGDTTLLTATLATGGLFGFGLASRVLSRGADPIRMAGYGALAGIPGFLLVMLAVPWQSRPVFSLGVFLIGFGGGLFGHGTLTATMTLAPKDQAGLALGAWGAVQATAAGVALAVAGVMRDVLSALASTRGYGPATGYNLVYSLEVLLLAATILVMIPLLRRGPALGRATPGRLEAAE
jgi:BCD family chlorophyll transporter-like MFS transporter